jgi:hypothetical protein
MTSDSKVADVLPLRPADHGSADPLSRPEGGPASPNAQRAQRAREGGKTLWAWGTLGRLQLLLSGASVIDSAPPALLVIWSRHSAAARFYKHWWARWPGFAYGFLHTFVLAAPAYFLVWATDSRPKLVATAVVIIATLWLLKVI